MPKIIALKGKANSGKTTTIHLLPTVLLANGYHQVSQQPIPPAGDFEAVFENPIKKIKLGVTSRGDTHDAVHNALDAFVNAGCDTCICACRTKDRVPPGTNAAVNSFPTHPPQFVPKTLALIAAQPAVNANDANTLFSLI